MLLVRPPARSAMLRRAPDAGACACAAPRGTRPGLRRWSTFRALGRADAARFWPAGCSDQDREPARPDPIRTATPEFYRRLNGAKRELALDFADPAGRAALREAVLGADVVITGARPRAFAGLGFDPEEIVAGGAVWVSITGYGWAHGARVAFGDDAAAAGGLVQWTGSGEPNFLGDALADPVTGLAAAIGALEALFSAGAMFVDAGLAPCAAGAAARMGLAP